MKGSDPINHTPENVISYWKRYIQLYMDSFPNTICGMHIAEIFPRNPAVLEQIVAYGAERYADRFQIQTDKLDGRKDQQGQHEYDLIRKYSSQIRAGFQTVSSFKNEERQGTMLMTLMNGIRAGARYYELCMSDGSNPAISKSFYDLWQEGKRVGWEKLMERAKEQGIYKTIEEDSYTRRSKDTIKGYPKPWQKKGAKSIGYPRRSK